MFRPKSASVFIVMGHPKQPAAWKMEHGKSRLRWDDLGYSSAVLGHLQLAVVSGNVMKFGQQKATSFLMKSGDKKWGL